MCGINEFNNKYIKRINNILIGCPNYIKGFSDYINNISLTTKYLYINHIINFDKYVNKQVDTLTLDDFSNYMSKMKYKSNGEQMTSSYIITIYSALKKFNQYLFESGILKYNYMIYLKKPKSIELQRTIIKRENGFLTKDEINIYLKTIKDNNINKYRNVSFIWNKRDLVIIKIFLYTGIRCSALTKLDIGDIDFKNKKLIITDKGDKVNIFELYDDLLNEIKEWLDTRKNQIDDNNSALFISNRRKRMDQSSISNVVKKYSKYIKGKNITPHKLRATYGTQLYNATGDIYFVQECMGHTNPKTTELYVRDKKQNTRKAMDIMSQILN